jgi:hypothetical protein
VAVNNPRNRIVIFRLTQDEYQTLQAASSEKGARNLSEFARGALLRSLGAPPLEEQLRELKSEVTRIASMLQGAQRSAAAASQNSLSEAATPCAPDQLEKT